MSLRVAWTATEVQVGNLVRRVICRSGHQADTFEDHATMLAADEIDPYDIVALRVNDHMRADLVRDVLRQRAPRVAVILATGCGCEGGPLAGHGVDPDAFDLLFKYPFAPPDLESWLAEMSERPHTTA